MALSKTQTRYYSTLTLKRLYGLSGNLCAFPGCNVEFVNDENDTNFSQICHIKDHSPNLHKKDRYDPNLSEEQKRHYDNLILLCGVHHIETNDPDKYSVEALKQMKQDHEGLIKSKLISQNLIKNPSALNIVIASLGERIFTIEDGEESPNAPNTHAKILYNNVILYKPIIEEYRVFQGRLNKIYEEIEKQGSTRKEFILINIKTAYLREKRKYATIEEIRGHADKIIENVEKYLWNLIENSSNFDTEIPYEALQISMNVILVDAFMRCNILEEPIV